MAVATNTVADMISRVSFNITNDSTADSNLSTEIQWALEAAMNRLCFDMDMPSFRKEHVITLTKDTQDYEMPDDFYRVINPGIRFRDDPNWTLEWYDKQDYDRIGGDWRMKNSSRPRHYTMRGVDEVSGRWMMRIAPKPDTDYEAVLHYFAVPARISSAATTDTLDKRFPSEFWDALVLKASTKFPQYLTREQIVVYGDQYQEALEDLRRTAMPVAGRIHQNRRYSPGPSSSGATWGLTGTDIVDPNGTPL